MGDVISMLDPAEEKFGELEDVAIETIQNEIEKGEKNEQSNNELWNNFKWPNKGVNQSPKRSEGDRNTI